MELFNKEDILTVLTTDKAKIGCEIKVKEDDSVKIADRFYLETSKTFNLFS